MINLPIASYSLDKTYLGKVEVLGLPGLKALVPGSSGVVGPYPLFLCPVLRSTGVDSHKL